VTTSALDPVAIVGTPPVAVTSPEVPPAIVIHVVLLPLIQPSAVAPHAVVLIGAVQASVLVDKPKAFVLHHIVEDAVITSFLPARLAACALVTTRAAAC